MNKLISSKPLAFMAALGVVVLGNLSASALNGDPLFKWWFQENGVHQIWLAIGTIIMLLLSMWHLYQHRSQFQSIRMITQKDLTDLHVGIILLLSSPGFVADFNKNPPGITLLNKETGQDVIIPAPDTDGWQSSYMKQDIGKLQGTSWSWQQLLRGVCYHYESVKYIYVISSKDTYETSTGRKTFPGSFPFRNHAKKILQTYKKNLVVKTHETVVDFEDFNELRSALETAIKWMRSKDAAMDKVVVNDKDIVIDITGGMKVSSATGAMVTLDNNITFQTVQTSGDYKVISFDVVSQAPASPM